MCVRAYKTLVVVWYFGSLLTTWYWFELENHGVKEIIRLGPNRWVKIITIQVTVCVSLGGSYLIFLGIRKLKIQIEHGIPTLLEVFLEGVEVMCFKHWAALWYMVGRQYGVFIILTVVTVCGTQSGKVLYSNQSVNEIALTTCLLEG